MSDQPLGEAFVTIRATLDQLDKDLAGARSKVGKALDGISANVKKAGKVAVAGVAAGVVAIGVGIAGIASQAIPAASDLNESINAVNVVFGDAAETIHEFGRNAADTAGLSQAAFSQMAAQTGAMLQNYGLDATQAADATVDLGQRAADMASIFNTDVGDAMTAINAALRGEADPIERYGVSMNAAAVEAHALALGLADSTGELDQAALTQARLSLLMQQTDKIAGDFVNTSDQLANAARVQSARWENFMASLGSFALPILTELQTLFMDLAEVAMPLILDALAPIAEVFGDVVSGVVSFVNAIVSGQEPIEAIKQLIYDVGIALGMNAVEAALLGIQFQDFIGRLQETGAAIWELLAPIVQSIADFVSWQDVLVALGIVIASFIIPTVVSLVASFLPIIATVAAIIAIVALLRNAWENDWGGIRTNLTAWWEETGKPIFDQLRSWLGENIPKAINTLKSFWENVLQPAIQAVWSWLSTVLIPFLRDELIPWISQKLTAAIQTLSDFWSGTLQPALQAIWSFISGDLVPLFESLWELFNVAGSLAIQALSGLWENTLQPALVKVQSFIETSVIPIFEALQRVINDELKPVLDWLSNQVLSKVTTGFENIRNAVVFVSVAVKNLIDKLKSIELPDALTPGSPTPFEIGLLGINEALKKTNDLVASSPLLGSSSLSLNPNLGAVMSGLSAEGTSGSVSYVSNTTVNTSQDPLRVLRASRHLDKLSELPA